MDLGFDLDKIQLVLYNLIQIVVLNYTKYCMEYRLDKEKLLQELSAWNGLIKRSVRLIACGGTALTLLGVKLSTKDVDLIVPEVKEYDYLIRLLKDLGYKPVTGAGLSRDGIFIFDLFRGNKIHTTELIEPVLNQGNHIPVKEFSQIYLGVLNYYDILISKLFRATSVDVEDCLLLFKAKRSEIDTDKFINRFRLTASFDVSEESVLKNLEYFLLMLKKEGLYHE